MPQDLKKAQTYGGKRICFENDEVVEIKHFDPSGNKLGPVVQSVVSLTSLLRVISLTVSANSIHNILIFFAEKM